MDNPRQDRRSLAATYAYEGIAGSGRGDIWAVGTSGSFSDELAELDHLTCR